MNPTRRTLLSSFCLSPLVLLDASPARSHHGFTGRYDISLPVWLQGILRQAAFQPPHPTITLEILRNPTRPASLPGAEHLGANLAERPKDRGKRLSVKFPPIREFFALADRIKVGDTIAVIALRNCAPPHQMRGQWLRLADGAVVMRAIPIGRTQSEVDGCGAS
jgi:hypothetical protein